MCFGGDSYPDPPDMTPIYNMLQRQSQVMEQLGREAIDFQKQIYGDQKALLDQVTEIQLPLMEEQAGWARDFYDRYQSTYAPIEDTLAEMAMEYDTPARREREAARAMQDVRASYEAQRRNAKQQLESYGIDPSQMQAQALDAQVRTAEAASEAAAANTARQRVEDVGRGYQFNVANIGRGFPGNTAQFTQGAVGTGGAISGQQTGQAQAFMPYMGNAVPYYQGATNATLGQGGLMSDIYGTQMRGYGYDQAYGSSLAEGIGQIGGTALGAWAGGGFPGFEDGGVVPHPGGAMPGEPRQAIPTAPAAPAPIEGAPTDRTAAALTPGEYVVPADVVRWKGEEFFEKTKQKSREARDATVADQRATQAQQALPVRPRANVSRSAARLRNMRGTPQPQSGGSAIPATA